MSLKILKSGLLDTIQDAGRTGYAHEGVPPCGPMDMFFAGLANALLGKDLDSAVIEMHFPAPVIEIGEPCVFCITGADFSPTFNDKPLEQGRPVYATQGILRFLEPRKGARAYLSVVPGFLHKTWLGSGATDLKSGRGGFERRLQTGDLLHFERSLPRRKKSCEILSWNSLPEREEGPLRIISGPEWNWLDEKGRKTILETDWMITPASDRMGFRLKGEGLSLSVKDEMLSSCVTAGTIQLLPNGELVIFMADHPTTGGYPRLASLATVDIGRLAQMRAGSRVRFIHSDVATAQKLHVSSLEYLEMVRRMASKEIRRFIGTP